ncbi:hypothetical protein ACHAPG_002825 [Botrytis cinerea]
MSTVAPANGASPPASPPRTGPRVNRTGTPTSMYSNTNSPVAARPVSPASSASSANSVSSNQPSGLGLSTTNINPPPVSPNSSVPSSPTGNANQPPKASSSAVSRWGIGWETPTLMAIFYFLALAMAFVHLFLFRYIDGKKADGPDRVAPQTYISTASNILANAFSFFLKSALTIAFVQHLWHLMRVQTMKISTIETLFGIKSNPLQIVTSAAIRSTPALCVISIIMSGMAIAASFPPGAINVISTQIISYQVVPVPTFNASFMGNGSGIDANAYSLMELIPLSPSGFVDGDFTSGKDNNLIVRLAREVLISGQTFTQSSPCGSNCSYEIQYEGPWIDCVNSSSQYYLKTNDTFTIYNGTWSSKISASLAHSTYNGTYTQATFNSSTLTPIKANGIHDVGALGGEAMEALVQEDLLVCSPGRALFTVNNIWEDNIQRREYDVAPISQLTNLALLTHQSEVIVPGFCAETGTGYGTGPANWSTAALDWYRDNNMMTIFASMLSFLDGEYLARLVATNSSIKHNDTAYYTDIAWQEAIVGNNDFLAQSTGENGTLIDSTRFNTAFAQYTPFVSSYPSFNMTTSTLNSYLFNLTTSAMLSYNNWNTTSNATIVDTINIYTFSQPLNLILPYFITLGVSLPFLLLGFWSLYRNGVSATDSGFIQLLATTTGSQALEDAAAASCLGGSNHIDKIFKETKIRFGELVDPNNLNPNANTLRRAGFGIESEVRDLEKGAQYGIMR